MSKPKKSGQQPKTAGEKVTKVGCDAHYGTKSDMFVADVENINMKDLFPNALGDKVIIAKDNEGMYLTGKAFVDAPSLDPYRLYRRIEVTEENGQFKFDANKFMK